MHSRIPDRCALERAPHAGSSRLHLLACCVAVAALLGACADAAKETPQQSVDKLYEEARGEMAIGSYDKAAKLFERMEGRAAGTVMAQQAQLEQAYALYKSGEKAMALAVIER